MTESYEQISLTHIDEDVDNHRLLSDSKADQELQASITANGVQQPIKVSRKDNDRYTLVFGFRRKAAAKAAGLETIPALVVEGLTVAEIRAMQAIENLERKQLHPLEEAQFCQDLVDEYDPLRSNEPSAEAYVAARIGRGVKWVEKRLALARLSERVKQGFMDGLIQQGHAELIAKLADHDAQEEVFGRVSASTEHWRIRKGLEHESVRPPMNLRETRDLVEARMNDLTRVPWKLDQPFAGKVACSECPQNSDNSPQLFDGDNPKQATCLDGVCFAEKQKATSRAVVKATNTLMKSGKSPTPKQAEKAITKREVEFVEPKAVAEAAKRRAAPKKKTGAEQRGRRDNDREWKIKWEFRDRMRDWCDKAADAIDELLPSKDPTGIAKMILIRESEVVLDFDNFETDTKAQQAAREKLIQALKLLDSTDKKSFHDTPLYQLADLLLQPNEAEHAPKGVELLCGPGEDEDVIDLLLEHYQIKDEVGPKPKREDVERELFPPKDNKAAVKKKAAKKAGRKKKATRKKARA